MIETLHSLFKKQISKRPNAPAFLIAAGDRSLPITWRQFGRDIDAFAWAGLKHVGKGERVGIIGENSYEWIAVHAACLMSGVVAVPLEPTLSAQERAIGGLGIFLVKKTMDEVVYHYEDGHNILSIKKMLR